MKHSPYLLDKNETWKEGLEKTEIYNSAIDDCISSTEEYWNGIKDRL
jgi:hypothetical protein